VSDDIADLVPAEPLPVRLMNTVWADRHGVHDDLTSVDRLQQWLERTGLERTGLERTGLDGTSQLGPEDLAAFRRLRAAARRAAAHVTADDRPAATAGGADLAAALADLNADTAACAPALVLDGGDLALRWRPGARAADRIRSELALETAQLLTGEQGGLLRACHAPGCVLYFVKDHPRREWCSSGCGNRARVARHYEKHRPRG
jgi:predicted RNA-binding Zn ribbon-like protein